MNHTWNLVTDKKPIESVSVLAAWLKANSQPLYIVAFYSDGEWYNEGDETDIDTPDYWTYIPKIL